MGRDYDHVGLLLCDDLVDILLDEGDQVLELHPRPEAFRKPSGDIRIVVTEDGYLQSVAFNDRIQREIRLSVVVADGVSGQEGNLVGLHIPGNPVINGMPGLDVVVAEDHGVIFHVFGHTRIYVGSDRVHIIEIVCGIVPLEDVSGIQKDHILLSCVSPDAVHHILHTVEGLLDIPSYIGRIEESTVDVVGSKEP